MTETLPSTRTQADVARSGSRSVPLSQIAKPLLIWLPLAAIASVWIFVRESPDWPAVYLLAGPLLLTGATLGEWKFYGGIFEWGPAGFAWKGRQNAWTEASRLDLSFTGALTVRDRQGRRLFVLRPEHWPNYDEIARVLVHYVYPSPDAELPLEAAEGGSRVTVSRDALIIDHGGRVSTVPRVQLLDASFAKVDPRGTSFDVCVHTVDGKKLFPRLSRTEPLEFLLALRTMIHGPRSGS